MRLSCSGAMGEEMWTEGRNRSSRGAVGVTRRSIEGNFFVWGIALRKSGRIYDRRCGFRRHCFDDRIYTVIAGLHAGLQGPNFESRRGTPFCDPESPFPQSSQQMLFLPFCTGYLATNIHELYTIVAGVARRLFSDP